MPTKPSPAYTPPVRNCRNPSTFVCLGKGYDFTSADSDQTQIKKMKNLYEPVIKRRWPCYSAFQDLLCYVHTPKCDMETKVVYRPCRSVCENARRKCEYVWIKYRSYGLSWPASFDCESMPDKYCFDSNSRPKDKGKNNLLSRVSSMNCSKILKA